MKGRIARLVALASVALPFAPAPARAACCYFAAKDKDVIQPAPEGLHHLGRQREGRDLHRPAEVRGQRPGLRHGHPHAGPAKLDEMPRDFFKELAVFTILKKREYPQSKLLPRPPAAPAAFGAGGRAHDGGKPRRYVLRQRAGGRHRRARWTTRSSPPTGPTTCYLAQGEQVQLRRRRSHPRLLRQEEVDLHRHEDRHQADEEEPRRLLHRRGHAHPLPVHLREARLPAPHHPRQRQGQHRGPLLHPGVRTRSTCPAT